MAKEQQGAKPPGRAAEVADVPSGDEQVKAKQAKLRKGKAGDNGQK